MPVVNYTTVNGRILHEDRNGVKTLFMPDTLGNVIETRNMDTGAQTSSTTYWPYGEVRTQTGTNPSPFGFCGVWGYYTQAGQPTYVRARYYRPNLGRWQTVDPYTDASEPFAYCSNSPIIKIDSSGLASTGDDPWNTGRCTGLRPQLLMQLRKCYSEKDAGLLASILLCIAYAESSCNPTAIGPGFNPKSPPFGLFQLGCDQYSACIDVKLDGCNPCQSPYPAVRGPDCGILRGECNTIAAVRFLLWLSGTFPGRSIENTLCRAFGTVQGNCRRRAENDKFKRCIDGHGLGSKLRTPMPKPLPNPGCLCHSSPTH